MKFLVDEALSPRLAEILNESGQEAVHVHVLGLTSAPDPVVFRAAAEQGRVLVTADTDFGGLAYFAQASQPSIVLFRGEVSRRVDNQALMLVENLEQVTADLLAGAIVVFGDNRVRVRRLPIERAL